jgi:hypothetical protein
VKPNINSVEVHPQLSDNGHPVDGVLVGALVHCGPWLARELESNRKLFPDHLPFILHGALVGPGSLETLWKEWGQVASSFIKFSCAFIHPKELWAKAETLLKLAACLVLSLKYWGLSYNLIVAKATRNF